MPNYFDQTNKQITINSSVVTNPSSKTDLTSNTRRIKNDFSSISFYINEVVYKAFTKLCSKTKFPYDVLESGISGLTIQTYPEEEGNSQYSSSCYWIDDGNSGRPATIKETFDCIISELGQQISVATETQAADLGPINEFVLCNFKRIDKIAKDAFGCDYPLDSCSNDATKPFSLAKHIYEIITQLTTNTHQQATLDGLNTCTGLVYPTLSLSLLVSRLVYDAKIPPKWVESSCDHDSLEEELDVLYDWLGKPCNETAPILPNQPHCAPFNTTGNLVSIIDEIIGELCDLKTGTSNPLIGNKTFGSTIGDSSVHNASVMNKGLLVFDYITNKWENTWPGRVAGVDVALLNGRSDQNNNTLGSPNTKTLPWMFGRHSTYVDGNVAIPSIGYNSSNGLFISDTIGLIEDAISYDDSALTLEQLNASTFKPSDRREILSGVIRSDLQVHNIPALGKISHTETTNAFSYDSNAGIFDWEGALVGIDPSDPSPPSPDSRIGDNIYIKRSGITGLIVLGPVSLGDVIYLAPWRLQKASLGVPYGLGIGVSEKWFDADSGVDFLSLFPDAVYYPDPNLPELGAPNPVIMDKFKFKLGVSLSHSPDADMDLVTTNKILSQLFYKGGWATTEISLPALNVLPNSSFINIKLGDPHHKANAYRYLNFINLSIDPTK